MLWIIKLFNVIFFNIKKLLGKIVSLLEDRYDLVNYTYSYPT